MKANGVIDRGKWSAARHDYFNPGMHLGGRRAGLGALKTRENSLPPPWIESQFSICLDSVYLVSEVSKPRKMEFILLQSKECLCMISGFRREVDEICALLGYYVECSGNFLPTFRDNLSFPSSTVKNSKRKAFDSWPFKMGPLGCAERSLRNYHYALRNHTEEQNSQEVAAFVELNRPVAYVIPVLTCFVLVWLHCDIV